MARGGEEEGERQRRNDESDDDDDLEKMVSDAEKMIASSNNNNNNNNNNNKTDLDSDKSITWKDNRSKEGDDHHPKNDDTPEIAATDFAVPEVGIEMNLTSSAASSVDNNAQSRQSTISNRTSSSSSSVHFFRDNISGLHLATINVVQSTWEQTRKKTIGCRDRNPRMWAILLNILAPLWVLIAISLFGGKYLARIEKPLEVQSNDNIMVNRYLVNIIRIENASQHLVELPVFCYQSFLLGRFFPNLTEAIINQRREENQTQTDIINGTSFNSSDTDTNVTTTTNDSNNSTAAQSNATDNNVTTSVYNSTYDNLKLIPLEIIPFQKDLVYDYIQNNITLPHLSWLNFGIFLKELNDHMASCGQGAAAVVDELLNIKSSGDIIESAQPLTFNWIRCWNTTEFGSLLVTRPTQAQIDAANNQGSYYAESWTDNQQLLYDKYLAEVSEPTGNVTAEDILYALNRSVTEATGDVNGTCIENSSGTAWFWFTVMTTMGYGNQAPASPGGRLFVALVGFLSIVLFAGMLTNAGSIIVVIWEDFVGRTTCCRWIRNPIFGCFIWFWITAGWTFFLGYQAKLFWIARGVYDEFVSSKWDPAWFAYISTTTVGLGDYYFPPEVMFTQDVFFFSFTFLVGFVFFATFLGHFLAIVNMYLPQADVGERLKSHLGHTALFRRWFERCFDIGGDENDSLYGDDDSDNSDDEDDEDQKHTIVIDGLTTAEILQKVLQEEQKREEDHVHDQQQLDLKDEEITLKELWKLKKAQQLRILQEEEALLRRLIENNSKQQEEQKIKEDRNYDHSDDDDDDDDDDNGGGGRDGDGGRDSGGGDIRGDVLSISSEKVDDAGGKSSTSKVLLTGDLKV